MKRYEPIYNENEIKGENKDKINNIVREFIKKEKPKLREWYYYDNYWININKSNLTHMLTSPSISDWKELKISYDNSKGSSKITNKGSLSKIESILVTMFSSFLDKKKFGNSEKIFIDRAISKDSFAFEKGVELVKQLTRRYSNSEVQKTLDYIKKNTE